MKKKIFYFDERIFVLREEYSLNSGDSLLLSYIIYRSYGQKSCCIESNKKLSELMRVSRSRISMMINGMAEKGLLVLQYGEDSHRRIYLTDCLKDKLDIQAKEIQSYDIESVDLETKNNSYKALNNILKIKTDEKRSKNNVKDSNIRIFVRK